MSAPLQPESRQTAGSARQSPAGAAHASPVALDSWRQWARGFAVAGVAGAFMAVVGAFGTGETPLLLRMFYWVSVMLAGAVQGRLTAVLVSRIPRAATNEWLYGAILATAIGAPATLLIWLYTSAVYHLPLIPGQLPYFFGAVMTVSAVMTAIMMLIGRPGRVTHALTPSATPGSPTPTAPRFLERLPPKLKGGLLYAIEAEDHYLRLHTSKGSDLILLRLADAVTELDGIEGAQTHRSWWVARAAVEGVQREGERVSLKLKDGTAAPVSRPNIRPLREAGWF